MELIVWNCDGFTPNLASPLLEKGIERTTNNHKIDAVHEIPP